MLDRVDAPRGEALAVANAVNLINNRNLGIAAKQKIGMQRVRRSRPDILHRAACRDQGLADDLPAEYPLPARLRRPTAEQIHFQRLEIQDAEDVLKGSGHAIASNMRASGNIASNGASVGVQQSASFLPGTYPADF
jgi:hypothetical protein